MTDFQVPVPYSALPNQHPKPRPTDMLERLEETKDGWPQHGSVGIGPDGKSFLTMQPAPQVLINPDGPEAAKEIRRLRAEVNDLLGKLCNERSS